MKLKFLEGKSKSEQYKLIAAAVLGVVAFSSLIFLFFGDSLFGSGSTTVNNNSNANKKSVKPAVKGQQIPAIDDEEQMASLVPIDYTQAGPPSVQAGRNIFDIFIPPTPTPVPIVPVVPTPTPTPPFTLTSVMPVNVYARTPDDFTLQISGDKFTPDSRISLDNNDLPTNFISPQQLSATVPASFITNPGARQVMIRTPDGAFYSNTGTLNVMPPPEPNLLYVGLIGDKYYNKDVAVLRDKNNVKTLIDVKRGQDVGGRFRVVSISEKEVVLLDKSLKIKHPLPFLMGKGGAAGPGFNNNQPQQGMYQQGEIPGIPNNIPRYQPPPQPEEIVDDGTNNDPNNQN